MFVEISVNQRYQAVTAARLLLLSADPEAGVAQALADVHQRHRGGESHQREPLSEQHGHPEAAQRGSVRLLQWPDDPGQSQAPKGQVSRSHTHTLG